MRQRFFSTVSVMYAASALMMAPALALIPVMGLTADETRAFGALIIVSGVYVLSLGYAQARFGWLRTAPIALPMSVLLATLGFAILFRVTHDLWAIYLLVPLFAALVYNARWAYLGGILSLVGFFSVATLKGMIVADPVKVFLASFALLVFTFLAGGLAMIIQQRAQRQDALATLAAMVSQSLTLERVLETALEQIVNVLDADATTILLLEGDMLVLRAQRGLTPEFIAGTRDLHVGEGISGRVAQTGKIQVVTSGLRRDARLTRQVVRQSAFESFVAVPLRARDQVMGVLNLAARDPRTFSAEDLAFFQAVADHIAMAIERAQLHEQVKGQRLNEQAILLEFSTRLVGLLDVERIFEQGVDVARQVFQPARISLMLADESRENLVLRAGYEIADDEIGKSAIRIATTRAGSVFQTGEPQAHRGDCSPDACPSDALGQTFASHLIVPLKTPDASFGVVCVKFREPRALETQDLRLLSLIANQTAIAYERARLHANATEQLERITALHDIDIAITSAMTLEQTLRVLLDKVAQRLHVDASAVALIDPATQELNYAARFGAGEDFFADGFLRVKEGVVGRVAHTGAPAALADVRAAPGFARRAIAERLGLVAYLAIPLRVREKITGVLEVAKRARHTFAPSEIDFFVTLGGQAAIAIENARLFELIEKNEKRFRALIENSSDVILLADKPGVIQYASPATARVLGYPPNEIVGASIFDLIHPDDLPHIRQLSQATVRQAGAMRSSEMRVRHRDGSWRWIEGVGVNLLDDPSVRFIVINVRDITERKDAERALERRAKESAALYDVARDLATQRDLPTLLQTIVECATALLGASSGTLTLYDAARGDLELVVAQNFPLPVGTRLKMGEGLAGRVAQTRAPLIVDDYQTWEHRVRNVGKLAFAAALGVPMLFHGELIGALSVREQAESPRRFTEADLRLLSLFAAQAASAVHIARLFDETRQRNAELAALNAVTLAANQLLDADQVMSLALDRVLQVIGAQAGEIFLLDAPSQELVMRMHRGTLDEPLLEKTRFKLGEGFPGIVAQSRQPLVSNAMNGDIRFLRHQVIVAGFHSCVCVPMINRDALIGTLGIMAIGRREFADHDVRLMQAIGDQLAIAIENARLFEETRRRALQQSALYRVSSALARARGVQEICDAVVREAHESFGYDHLSIFLLDPATGDRVLYAQFGWDAAPSPPQTWRLPPGKGLSEGALITCALQYTPDISAAAQFVRVIERSRSEVDVPILIGATPIGVLIAESPRLDGFDADDRALLQAVTDQLAVALEQARLFEAEQTRRAELGALYDLARALADENEIDAILDQATRRAVETVHVTFARIALIENGQCVIRAAHPISLFDRALGAGRRESPSNLPACQRAVQRDEPTVLHLGDAGFTPLERDVLFGDIAKSVCLVPLRVGERVLGMLMLGEARKTEREPFSAEKIRLARGIGDQAASALVRAELFAEIERAYLQTVLALANAVDAKDNYTADHARRLAEWARAIGRESGLSERDLDDLHYAAILHDVGKIGVPDAILRKPATLTADEWIVMRQHPEIGAHILAPVPRLVGVARIVRHHHERYDGAGYPDGLAGDAIPLGARILTVVDSYSAIIDERVYKPARSHKKAVAELKRYAGAQFDSRIVEIFLRLLENGLVGKQ